MKKIVDVIKLGESVGRKLSDNATETDKRRISDWDETASGKEEVLEKLSDPDYIQEKTLYYKSFDIAGAWKRAKVRKLAQQKSMHSKMRKLVWGAAAAVTVLLSATVYLFQQDDIVKENVEVHQGGLINGAGRTHHYDALADVPQFPDIAGPAVLLQQFLSFRGQFRRRGALFGGDDPHLVLDQREDIFGPLPQRGNMDLKGIEAVE